MKKKVIIFSIIFLIVLFSNKINAKAIITDGFIIGNEVYENLTQNKEVSNGWGYDSSSNTLILNNYSGGKIQVFLEQLNIKLVGNNYINDVGIGIESSANLFFDGSSGSLNIHMSGENSTAITGKNVSFSQGQYNFTVLSVGIFVGQNSISIDKAIVKVVANGMGFQASRNIIINDSQVNLRTNYTSIYSIYETITISNSKVISISKSRSLEADSVYITNNSVLALEATSQAIRTDNLNIDDNLSIIGGNNKGEVTNINNITNQKYVYINRTPNTNFPLNLKIEKSGSRLILTWDNNLNFNILFENQIHQIPSNLNGYELEITDIKDNYQIEIYSIDDDGIESYHLIKSINNDGNPNTKDNLLESVFCIVLSTCILIYLFVKIIKNKKNT